MKKLLFRILVFLQVHAIWRRWNRHKILIVTYHGFTAQSAFKGIENRQGMHLNIQTFRRQLQYLASHYHVVPLDQVIAHYSRGTPLPHNSAVITIDDGYRSAYTLAYPVLKEFGFPAIMFVATDFLDGATLMWADRIEYALNTTSKPGVELSIGGAQLSLALQSTQERAASACRLEAVVKAGAQESMNDVLGQLESRAGVSLVGLNGCLPEIYGPLEWSEAAEMASSGLISVGGHTKTHVILSRCAPAASREELAVSKRVIEERLGQGCQLFCYPNGVAGDFDSRTREQLIECGYVCGLTTVPGLNGKQCDVMELKRLGAAHDMFEFMITMSGFRLLLASIKGSAMRGLRISRPAANPVGGK